ncbi:hypothetical protein SAMN02745132_00748 [Enterovibrio nigricans DSM 22720]|uniref:Uncharacterized protein n=1 Tax=Enterovibrio nigricans DSM 22720 TaxID=1121868 RepID=A0A1T4U4W6_9GAMM|nr:hypothetical protein SAMN02745132_00748 [Enterovibrio nigricans DSM 22720]
MNKKLCITALALFSSSVFAEAVSVEMIDLSSGQSAGTVMIHSSDYGTVFTPTLQGYLLVCMASICTKMAHATVLPKVEIPY